MGGYASALIFKNKLMNAQTSLFSTPFYNTIGKEGNDLKTALKRAEKQETRVYDIFARYGIPLTPFEVSQIYDKMHSPIPLTSVRRSISNLTKDGKLVKTEEKKPGAYGENNYLWKLA